MTFFATNGEPLKNPYQLLGLERGASDDEVNKAFKKLMLKFHPDKQPAGQSAEKAAEISANFHDVMDAKSFLLDAEHMAARRAYESKLAALEQNVQQFDATKTSAHRVTSKTDIAKHYHTRGKANRRASSIDDFSFKNSTAFSRSKPSRRNSCDGCSTTSADNSSSDDDLGIGATNNRPFKSSWKKVNPMGNSNKPCTIGRKTTDDADPSSNRAPRRYRVSSNAENADGSRKKCHQIGENVNLHSSCGSFFENKKKKSEQKFHQPREFRMGMSGNKSPKSPTPARKTKVDVDAPNSPFFPGKSTSSPKPKVQQANNNSRVSEDFSSVPSSPLATIDTNSFAAQEAKKRISNSIDIIAKQFQCPLTTEIINDPMTDFEGNNYERTAILKYLENHNTSPVTGNPLYPCHLTPNNALKERIKHTVKLRDCLDSLGKIYYQ